MVDAIKTIFAKKEAVYATDAAPTAALNAALTRNYDTTPLEMDVIERNLDLPTRGGSPAILTNPRQAISFELEAAGSGTPGTPPAWCEYLEACGMAPPVSANGAVTQKFAGVTDAQSALTLYHWDADQRRRGLGARGTFGFNFTAGAVPFFNFQFTALVPAAGPVDKVAPGTPVFTRWKTPVDVNSDNTDFLLDGYAAVLKSLTGEIAADISVRNLVGAKYVRRGNHAATVRILIEAPDIASKDYFDRLAKGSLIAVQLIHGIAAGNIVQLDSANLQITAIRRQVDADIVMYEIAARLVIVAGGDDLILTAK